ncbi:acyltransferase family protein [Photobacterium leiognathi subsp. mandapamensis]|uniref:acyltransferase family protein n=1 Tax=Photobacterium leiognathi TaxID=553611 RepID=UPI003BF4AC2F
MSNRTFDFVHMLRGVAILFVIWSHLGGWWLSLKVNQSFLGHMVDSSLVRPFHLYQNGGHLGVLIFFLISGFIITHVSLRESVYEFVIKRLFRIFPPLLVSFLIIYIIVSGCVYYSISLPLGMGVHSFSDYVQSIFLINYINGTPAVNGVTWTLLIEIVFYLFTALLIKKTKTSPVMSTYIMMFFVAIIIILSPYSPYIKALANLSVYVLFLLFGRIYYFSFSNMIDTKNTCNLFLLCSFLYISFYQFLYPGLLFSASTPAYPPIYSDVLAIIIFLISAGNYKKIGKVNLFLSNTSYSMYLLHLPVGGLALVLLDRIGMNFELSFTFALTLCLLVSYIMLIFIERPSQMLARKILMEK